MESPGPAWTAGQVAQHLGISESTLRTWHRRYGLQPRDSQPGHYRRYRGEDVARLRRMCELVQQGMLASEAARIVQEGQSTAVSPGHDADALVAAARTLDTTRCGLLLDGLLARRGAVDAWELVCRPALRAVDSGPEGTPALTAVEHVLTWSLSGALHRLSHPPVSADRAAVLLACTEGEQHTLPLAALSAALAERGIPSHVLGAATPAASLERAVLTTRPGAVVLWAQREETARPAALHALRSHPAGRIAAGPGWEGQQTDGAQLVTTLPAALVALTAHHPYGAFRRRE